METISVSNLKAHLSAELRKVEEGTRILVLDHKRPVAVLEPVGAEAERFFLNRTVKPFVFVEHEPLIDGDPVTQLMEDREDRW